MPFITPAAAGSGSAASPAVSPRVLAVRASDAEVKPTSPRSAEAFAAFMQRRENNVELPLSPKTGSALKRQVSSESPTFG